MKQADRARTRSKPTIVASASRDEPVAYVDTKGAGRQANERLIMKNIQALHAKAVAEAGRRVMDVGSDQWSGETPCADWDVAALVNHMISGNHWVGELVAGRTIAEVGDKLDGDFLRDDAAVAWSESESIAVGAFGRPGAMERTVHLSFGDFSGQDYCEQRFVDMVIHQWDVAEATGGDTTIDPELVEAAIEWTEPNEEMLRSGGATAPRPGKGEPESRQALLLAMWGRQD